MVSLRRTIAAFASKLTKRSECHAKTAKTPNHSDDAITAQHPAERKKDDYTPYEKESMKQHPPAVASLEIGRGFFRLPAELRIAIYEYVLPLGETFFINLKDLLCVPALLLVSSQIRRETRDMWYKNNRFCMAARHCNSELPVAWTRHFRDLDLHDIDVEVAVTGTPDWYNLMEWCKAVYDEGTVMADLTDDEERIFEYFGMQATVAATLRVAQRCKRNSLPWAECEAMLADLQNAFAAYDSRWW
ncbi:hypothetical protein LTR27_011258 [Elasticomyces elasticus]|nr:hypothetical protein LTR27_011258 [Elasticomyces elasticus]